MSKHTPGPWKMIEGKAELRQMSSIVLANDPDYIIGYVTTEDTNKAVRAEDLANARLIAAAPDLLGALVNVLAAYRDSISGTEVHAARKAIAKATGE